MSRQRSDEVISTAEFVSIGELARLTSVRYSTIKFYTEEGFIPFEQLDKKLTRRYKRDVTVSRIEYILKLRDDGLTIAEIKEKLSIIE